MSKAYDRLKNFNYMIGIPSRGRSFMIEKRTGVWKYFKEYSYPISIFIREEEVLDYGKVLTGRVPKFDLVSCSNGINIAEKRQEILNKAIKENKTHLFIIDDDINFYYREESLSSKYSNKMEEINSRDTVNKCLLECIALCNEEYPIVGLPLKQGSQAKKYTFELNSQIIHFACYHIPTLIKESIKVTELGTPFMSDRYVQLSLLNKGYRSITNCRYAIGDYGTGYRGGCSITRNVLLQEDAARKLLVAFPGYVELRHKENGVWNNPRLDCKIHWKKFLKKGFLQFIPKEKVLKIIGEMDEF